MHFMLDVVCYSLSSHQHVSAAVVVILQDNIVITIIQMYKRVSYIAVTT